MNLAAAAADRNGAARVNAYRWFLVRDMTEILTRMCAQVYGRRAAANRAKRAIVAADDGEAP